MKAIVVETDNKKSVVLAADGSYYTVKGSYKPGEEIEYHPVIYRRFRSFAAIAAAFLIFFSGFNFYDQNYAVFASVTMTEAASIKFDLNKKDEILKLKALDRESEDIVDELKKEGIDKRVKIEDGLERAKKIIKKKRGKKAKVTLTVQYGRGMPAGRRASLKRKVDRAQDDDFDEFEDLDPEEEPDENSESDFDGEDYYGPEYDSSNYGTYESENSDSQKDSDAKSDSDQEDDSEKGGSVNSKSKASNKKHKQGGKSESDKSSESGKSGESGESDNTGNAGGNGGAGGSSSANGSGNTGKSDSSSESGDSEQLEEERI